MLGWYHNRKTLKAKRKIKKKKLKKHDSIIGLRTRTMILEQDTWPRKSRCTFTAVELFFHACQGSCSQTLSAFTWLCAAVCARMSGILLPNPCLHLHDCVQHLAQFCVQQEDLRRKYWREAEHKAADDAASWHWRNRSIVGFNAETLFPILYSDCKD